jgi:hypothetical protein
MPLYRSPSLVRISETVSAGASGTVTITDIPANFRDLVIVVRGRGDTAATSVGVSLRFNNDSGANYDDERVTGANGALSESTGVLATSAAIGSLPAATGLANDAGLIEIAVQDYRGTTFFKAASGLNAYRTGGLAANFVLQMRAAYWRSQTAITRVDVIASAGNFASGSVISLYGRS